MEEVGTGESLTRANSGSEKAHGVASEAELARLKVWTSEQTGAVVSDPLSANTRKAKEENTYDMMTVRHTH